MTPEKTERNNQSNKQQRKQQTNRNKKQTNRKQTLKKSLKCRSCQGRLSDPILYSCQLLVRFENPEKSYRRDDNEVFFRQMKKNLKKKIKLNIFGKYRSPWCKRALSDDVYKNKIPIPAPELMESTGSFPSDVWAYGQLTHIAL